MDKIITISMVRWSNYVTQPRQRGLEQQVIEKFFDKTCTVEEAGQVLKWLATEDGQAYLAKKLDKDEALWQDERLKPMLPEVSSKRMWSHIKDGLELDRRQKTPFPLRKKAVFNWAAAAIILMVSLASILYYWQNSSIDQTAKINPPIHFIAGANQQKTFTLKDGTKIRLNSHSQLWISRDYGHKIRKITLEGEAYFDVRHNEAKPFMVVANGVLVKDIGTTFDVKAIPGRRDVQVVVTSGEVSIRPEHGTEEKTVRLREGQFGYMNLKTDSVAVNEFAVKNYLSWMGNRIEFDDASLMKASEQLSRIYHVSFAYAADSLKGLIFSADFEEESLKKALAVISLTLSINYQIKGHKVIWAGSK